MTYRIMLLVELTKPDEALRGVQLTAESSVQYS